MNCSLLLLLLLSAASTEASDFSESISQLENDQMLSMSESADVNDIKGRHLLVIPWPGVICIRVIIKFNN